MLACSYLFTQRCCAQCWCVMQLACMSWVCLSWACIKHDFYSALKTNVRMPKLRSESKVIITHQTKPYNKIYHLIPHLALLTLVRHSLCSTQLPVHQRMNANGVRYQMIYFPEKNIQWITIPFMVIMYNCCTMHDKHLLKMWRARLLRLWPSHCIYPPPLSEANCTPFPPPGGPGPPASKMASFSPGSTHTPSPPSVTLTLSKKVSCDRVYSIYVL